MNDNIYYFIGLAVIQFLTSIWVKSRLELSIKSEYDRKLADYNYELRKREQSAIVANLFSNWIFIKDTSRSEEKWRDLNRLSFEVSLWLPDEVAIEINKKLKHLSDSQSIENLIIECRKIIHGKDTKLSPTDITFFGTKS